MILENNPFYAASLTPRAGGGFELINYDPVGKETTYSTRVMRTIGRNGPRVNVKFSVKPEGGLAIDGYDVYENGVKIPNPPEDEEYKGSASPLQYFASAALYDLFYISQVHLRPRTSAPPHPRTSAPPHLRTSAPPRLRAPSNC